MLHIAKAYVMFHFSNDVSLRLTCCAQMYTNHTLVSMNDECLDPTTEIQAVVTVGFDSRMFEGAQANGKNCLLARPQSLQVISMSELISRKLNHYIH